MLKKEVAYILLDMRWPFTVFFGKHFICLEPGVAPVRREDSCLTLFVVLWPSALHGSVKPSNTLGGQRFSSELQSWNI